MRSIGWVPSAAALGVLLAAGGARAQSVEPRTTSADGERMRATMHAYFHDEKYEGLFFMGSGLASVVAGTAAVTRGTDFGRALSGPLFALGAIQFIAGAVVFLRTDAQVARLDAQLSAQPGAFREGELPRMRGVNQQFVLLEVVETAFIVGGVVSAVAGLVWKNDIALGIGIGLAAEAGLLFTLDQFAHARGREYERALAGFAVTVAPSERGTGFALAWGTVF